MIRAEEPTCSMWQDLVRSLTRYIGRRVANPEDRDDLVQDVLLRVHRGLADLKSQQALGPWVYKIANNAVIDYWRRNGRPSPVLLGESADVALEVPANDEDVDRLQQILADLVARMVPDLPSPYRETLILTELKGMKTAQVARQLGISLAATKSRVLRGRKLLREALARCCELEIGTTGRVLECTPPGGGHCGPTIPIALGGVEDAVTLARRKR